jgi:hypothetical protein
LKYNNEKSIFFWPFRPTFPDFEFFAGANENSTLKSQLLDYVKVFPFF